MCIAYIEMVNTTVIHAPLFLHQEPVTKSGQTGTGASRSKDKTSQVGYVWEIECLQSERLK